MYKIGVNTEAFSIKSYDLKIKYLFAVNHALTKPLLIRNPVSWKYGQTVDILWRPFQMAFAVDTLVSLDLYIPKVSYIYWSDIGVLWTDFPL